MKVYVETYGCAANRNNSEIIISKALSFGHDLVSNEREADLIVVNTCTVKHLTEQKIFSRLEYLKGLNKKVVVTGCMIPYQEEEIKSISDDFLLVEWNELDKFNAIFGNGKTNVIVRDDLFSFSEITKIIQINTGCLGNCSYCATKLVKGNVISKPIDEIMDEVENAIKKGFKEIYLTSTDTAAYGWDIGTRLPALIEKILELDGDYIIRVGMMNPMLLIHFYKDFIELYANKKLYKFLHLPIQSGSEKVLMEMNRPTAMKDIYDIHHEFMRITNTFGNFSTDIIVGYPTETDKDFNRSVEVIKNLMPDMTHVSKFGPRKGTPAAKLKKLPSQIVKDRSRKMSLLVKEIAKERNRRWVGKETEVLINAQTEKYLAGRNRYYKKIIILNEDKRSYLGRWVKVKITSYTHSHLIGEII